MDELLADLYLQGMPLKEIAKAITKRYKVPRNEGAVQSRLGILRRDGYVEQRNGGKTGPPPKKKAKAAARKAPVATNNGPRVLQVDLGAKGGFKVEIWGALVLHEEALDDMARAVMKLMVA